MALNSPVPSKNFDVLERNMEDLDRIVNSNELSVSLRGAPNGMSFAKTLRGLESSYIQTPINGGVWAVGIQFTARNQFMIYNGQAWKVKNSTSLPYTSTATPDVNFVEIFTDLNSENATEIQEQVSAYSIWPVSINADAQIGQSVTQSNALRQASESRIFETRDISGNVTNVSGEITALNFINKTATIGGVSVVLSLASFKTEVEIVAQSLGVESSSVSILELGNVVSCRFFVSTDGDSVYMSDSSISGNVTSIGADSSGIVIISVDGVNHSLSIIDLSSRVQEDSITDSNVYPLNAFSSVSIGDTLPVTFKGSAITHLRVINSNGNGEIREIGGSVSGEITALSDSSITAGGTTVALRAVGGWKKTLTGNTSLFEWDSPGGAQIKPSGTGNNYSLTIGIDSTPTTNISPQLNFYGIGHSTWPGESFITSVTATVPSKSRAGNINLESQVAVRRFMMVGVRTQLTPSGDWNANDVPVADAPLHVFTATGSLGDNPQIPAMGANMTYNPTLVLEGNVSGGGQYSSQYLVGTNGVYHDIHANPANSLRFVNTYDHQNGVVKLQAGAINSTKIAYNNQDVFLGKVATNTNLAGIEFKSNVQQFITTPDNYGITLNRLNSDGVLMHFSREGASQGSISVAGGVVSYNSFYGSHKSQLEDYSKPEIIRGTVCDYIDEPCEFDGEIDPRLPKFKISDSDTSKTVYGVFGSWEDTLKEDNITALIGGLGVGFVRMDSGVEPEIGELIVSAGNGCAKLQGDDIKRSSTIGKILSTNKVEIYDDGSYLISCQIDCG